MRSEEGMRPSGGPLPGPLSFHRRRPPRRDPRPAKVLARGLTRRCPRCGGGGLFRSWMHPHATCRRCGWRLTRDGDGFGLAAGWLCATVTCMAVSATVLVGSLLTLPDIPQIPLTAVAIGVAVVVAFATYPVCVTTWAAIDLLMRPPEFAEQAAAEIELLTSPPPGHAGPPDVGSPS